MSSLNVCRNDYYAGGAMGGMRRATSNKVTCPTCGKRVQVTRAGMLRAHGTRRNDAIKKENR